MAVEKDYVVEIPGGNARGGYFQSISSRWRFDAYLFHRGPHLFQ